MTIRKLTKLALLTALSCVLRLAFGSLPNIKPITALFFVIMLTFGLVDGLFVSSLTMLVTGFLMGFSPIIIGQILSYAVILTIGFGLFKGVRNLIYRTIIIFCLTMLYGFVISIFSARLFGASFLPFWLSGLTFDLAHAVSTALFFPVLVTIFKNKQVYIKR
ncbi:membrane protein [Lactococcus hodotermopsidis]|uniref:Membrane protein n=1 Tax=Pseudolactococcus hodotermopsidis TaxID=2709157 RepID=A0A6A0BBP8_9LACT|nr:ECF transporter S component [Lactococcus hodotermopsidis]GFH42103.1 membrane protein [Lactococcus hodotermopsidis]